MLKRFFLLLSFLFVFMMGSASAAQYAFEDKIDKWGCFNWDSVLITNGNPLEYTHDLNDDVNFSAGDLVTEAWLELDFTNDDSDDKGSLKTIFGVIKWNYRENAKVAYDGSVWKDLGEVDNGQYEIVLDIDWLNDDGLLDVVIKVNNSLGTATAWLDHSRLYGTAETAPVPEPATLFLMGTGFVGLVRMRRKK